MKKLKKIKKNSNFHNSSLGIGSYTRYMYRDNKTNLKQGERLDIGEYNVWLDNFKNGRLNGIQIDIYEETEENKNKTLTLNISVAKINYAYMDKNNLIQGQRLVLWSKDLIWLNKVKNGRGNGILIEIRL